MPGGVSTVLALAGAVLVVAGWVWWGRSVVALGLGAAWLMAGVLGWFGAPGPVVALVAGLGGVALTVLFWRWRRLVAEGNTLPPGVGAVRLVGMEADVRRAVGARGVTPIGQVRVKGETWGAWTDEADAIASGSSVVVVEVRGTRLVVARPPHRAPDNEVASGAGSGAAATVHVPLDPDRDAGLDGGNGAPNDRRAATPARGESPPPGSSRHDASGPKSATPTSHHPP